MNRLMKLTVSAVVLFVLLTAQQAQPQLADSPWPMFMHDAQHTGRSPYVGPEAPNLAWTLENAYSPLVDLNGIIYVKSHSYHISHMDYFLEALGPDGRVKWQFDGYLIPQAIDKNWVVYCTSSDSNLYAFNKNGSLKWKCNVGHAGGDVVIDEQGNIYVGNYLNLSCVDVNGNLIWQYTKKPLYPTYNRIAPAIGQDGTIYIADGDGVKAINPNGTRKWTYALAEKATGAISIAKDSTIYVGTYTSFPSEHQLYALKPNGLRKWAFSIGDYSTAIRSAPAISSDGEIYAGFGEGRNRAGGLCAINPDGTLKWIYRTECFTGSPIIDADGVIYAASEDGYLYAFNADGTEKWKYNFGQPWSPFDNFSNLAIDSTGTLYFEKTGYSLYAFFRINPEAIPDLSVTGANISFDPPSGAASANTPVKITAPVKEMDGTQSAAFDVTFYVNDLSHAIDTVKAYAPPGFTSRVEGTWNTEGFKGKTYQIIAVVKNANPAESNTSNNQAQASYQLLPSLQERINAAQTGDTVWVAPGRYYENLTLKNGVVVKSTHGPEQTIIDGRKKNSVVKALHLDPTAVLDGFTLTNGYAQTFGGGGVYIERGGVTIRNNIIRRNEATKGGAIWMIGSFVESYPLIENNLIIDNYATFDGGAVYANNSWASFINNTVVNNRSSWADRAGGIHTVGYWSPTAGIVNCIIWGNGINLGGTAAATYSCIQNSNGGTGNIFVDPQFVDTANGDYHLQPGSPCIDAGNPDPKYNDHNGSRNDMGAYGGPLGTKVEMYPINELGIPLSYTLFQNYPNPFNPETTVKFQLPKTSEVTIKIYNIAGQLVKTLVEQRQSAGYYSINWNGKDEFGRDLASGLYFYNLKTKDFVQTKKMLLVR